MPLDTVLLWLGLFSGVALLARGAGGLWAGKAVLLLLVGVVGLLTDPLQTGWAVGAIWAVFVLIPMLLARLGNALVLAQRPAAALPVYAVLCLLHPDPAFRAQIQLMRALADAQRGAFALATARLDRLARNARAPPTTALIASFNRHRFEGRLDFFVEKTAWDQDASAAATMVHLAALAILGRVDALVAVQAEQGPCLRTSEARQSLVTAYALVALFTATGRVSALERLCAGPLRRFPAELRAFHRAMARFAAGTAGAEDHETLARLAQSRNRDLALRATRLGAAPPAAVSLHPEQGAIVDAAEADMNAMGEAHRTRPRLLRSPVTLVLIAINLAAFAAELAFGGGEDERAIMRLGALLPSLVTGQAQWWRIPAATFLHLGWVHLTVNMLALASIGTAVEQAFGRWRTVAIYGAAGLGSMAGIVLLVSTGHMAEEWVVGASGAIMGLFGALIVDAARHWRSDRSPASRKRLTWMVGLVILQGTLDVATPQISFAGHALGVAIGILAAAALGPRKTAAPVPSHNPVSTTPPPTGPARRRTVQVLLASMVVGAVAAAFPRRREQAELQAARRAAAAITPAQLAAIRQLRFIFLDEVEAGAPAVDPTQPFGSPNPLADLAAVAKSNDLTALRLLYERVMDHLPRFCAEARLAPGAYAMDGTQVNISPEQLRLIPALSWEVPDFDDGVAPEDGAWPVSAVDIKRPYGDMTYFEADMAAALGIPVGQDTKGRANLPDDVLARLDTLHRSMAGALQVFVRHAAWPEPR